MALDTPSLKPAADNKEDKEPAVGYVHTTNFPELLRRLKLSLMVTTYQAQRVLTFSPSSPEKLFMLMRVFERPTGLAIDGAHMALCAKNRVWVFKAPAEIRDAEGKQQPYDLCYVPRVGYVTGDIAGHEMAFLNGKLHIVNTRFSCISTLNEEFSFTPGWKPPWITELAPEDRCHLNGMAVANQQIHFLSALGETNTKEGWRENKASGGVVVDYHSGKIVSRGLSMPHSPRIHAGALWILNSGLGELQIVDPRSGERRTAAKLPGFLRGLAFYESIGFIGLSKIREKKTFGNLPVEDMYPQLDCAIYAVDLKSGQPLGFIKFTKGIEELFDIQILPGIQSPHMIGFEEETINGLFLLP